MKKICIIVWLAVFAAVSPAQELDSLKTIMDNKKSQDSPDKKERETKTYSPVTVEESGDEVKIRLGSKELIKVIDGDDSTYIIVGDKKVLEVIDQPDSTRIRVGDKEISIVEKNDDTRVHVGNADEGDDEDLYGHGKFRGHWAGVEWGINNMLDKDLTLSREEVAEFMDLRTDRSWCLNLNVAQYSLGFGSSQVGLLTGLGLGFNNYYFDHDNTIAEVDDYVSEIPLDGTNLVRSKLTASFIRIPLLLEVQFPGSSIRSNRVFLSAGILAGIKLGSHTKVVYKDDGKSKDKDRDDFNINPFRYGLTFRMGYHNISVFGDYSFTPFFVRDKGPELYPFSAGLSVSF